MYFYNLSSGAYSDYHDTLLMHEKKFTRKEFIELYNKAVAIEPKGWDGDIAEIMCNKFGFKPVIEEIHIGCGYGFFKPITNQHDIDGEHTFIDTEKQK